MDVTRNRSDRKLTPAVGQSAGRGRRVTPAMIMGRYRMFERIREQELGDTFVAATQGVDGTLRHVVVKRLHPNLGGTPTAVRRFVDEARLQSKLLHPHVVQVVAFGTEADQHFVAYEYVQGKRLDRLVRRHLEVFGKPLPVPVACYILYGVLEALAYVHSRVDENRRRLRIIHGNVNPGNVLISFRGEVKVAEFAGLGISGGASGRPKPDRVAENPGFMSPEQARGEPADARSDQFSAGLVLYYALTGLSLWETNQTALRRLPDATSTEFRSDPRIPPAISEVLRRALALDSSTRYVTARELGRKLGAHFIAGRDALAELMQHLFPQQQRRPTMLGAIPTRLR